MAGRQAGSCGEALSWAPLASWNPSAPTPSGACHLEILRLFSGLQSVWEKVHFWGGGVLQPLQYMGALMACGLNLGGWSGWRGHLSSLTSFLRASVYPSCFIARVLRIHGARVSTHRGLG